MSYGANLKALREAKKITQIKLGELMGTTQQTIQRLESGERGFSEKWLRAACEALGVAPSDIVGDGERGTAVPFKLEGHQQNACDAICQSMERQWAHRG